VLGAIELQGTEVAPIVRRELASDSRAGRMPTRRRLNTSETTAEHWLSIQHLGWAVIMEGGHR
jgi:hypothetical protein